jgi:hypothetical protein
MRATPLLLIATIVGCNELPSGLANFAGTFSYMASDGIGRPAFGGTLRLVVNADSTVVGTHDLVGYRLVGGSQSTVVGRVSGDSIFLWLDPNPDSGILMNAHASIGGGFSGTWSSNTIAGPIPGGTVFAQRTAHRLPVAP